MDRTKARPIPSGRISPRNALIFGLLLAAISLFCAWSINYITLGLMAFGLFDNIIVYSKWLKRKSQTNIILGGFSGGCSSINRICSGYDRTPRNRINNGRLSFPMDTNAYLELGIACKERLYKSWCSHVACRCRRKEICSSDSRYNSLDGSI